MSRRTTIVLGVVAAAAVAAAIAVSLTGRSSESKQHRALAQYVTAVDAVQQDMTLELARVRYAYRTFSTTAKGGNVKELARAESTLRTLERRLATVDAPPTAATLRRLLLELAALNVAIAKEVHQLAVFLPALRSVVAVAQAAAKRLSRGLAAAKPPTAHTVRGTAAQIAAARAAYAAAAAAAAKAQADAVDTYDATLGRVLVRLRSLHPPSVLAPTYRSQVAAYTTTRAAGAALARELRKTDPSRVPVLSRRFVKATRLAASDTAQKAQIAAVKAYNARVKRTQTLQTAIQTELGRLQSTVR